MCVCVIFYSWICSHRNNQCKWIHILKMQFSLALAMNWNTESSICYLKPSTTSSISVFTLTFTGSWIFFTALPYSFLHFCFFFNYLLRQWCLFSSPRISFCAYRTTWITTSSAQSFCLDLKIIFPFFEVSETPPTLSVSFSEAIVVYLDKQVGLPSSTTCHEQTES